MYKSAALQGEPRLWAGGKTYPRLNPVRNRTRTIHILMIRPWAKIGVISFDDKYTKAFTISYGMNLRTREGVSGRLHHHILLSKPSAKPLLAAIGQTDALNP